MKPSDKAIEAAYRDYKLLTLAEQIEAAYAIDIDPLLAERDKEIERLKDCEDQSIKRGQEVIRLGQRISELEAENARLHDLVETYCPSDERAGTPDQTRM